MPTFSIIIVSWNALHHLETFLPSVVETDYPEFEIILADNASTDGSADWVREQFPGVKIVTFDDNYGYCGGNNRAVPQAEGDILIFLNNDVQVEPDWLHPLAKLFKNDSDIGAVQPKVRSYRDPDYFEYAGAAGGFIDKYGFPFCRGRLFKTIEKDVGQYDQDIPIFWASGAALAVRRDHFEEIGGFDEDFEFHMEEIDLCWQLWNRGHEVRFCPESVVYHLGGGSLATGSPRKVYYNFRNNLIMLWKNYSQRSLAVRFPVRIFLDLVAALHFLIELKFRSIVSMVKAHKDFWMSVNTTHKKRLRLQKKRVSSDDPIQMKELNLVVLYFLAGKTTFTSLPDD